MTIPALAAGLFLTGSLVARADTSKGSDTTTRDAPAPKTQKKQKHVKDHGSIQPETSVAADNTATNKRDRDEREPTADQQKNNKSDLELTAEIRRAIVDDKTLSMNAHNIKVIVEDGDVTLKGPVASRDEKANLAKKASDIVSQAKGKGKITNELAVAP